VIVRYNFLILYENCAAVVNYLTKVACDVYAAVFITNASF
jgi:hypothetical protein